MRKILIWFLIAGILTSNAQSILVSNCSSSADININSVEKCKLYYILRKTSMPLGNGQSIKDTALSGGLSKNFKKGKISILNPELNQTLTQSLTQIQANTSYYLYTFFEASNG